MLVFPNIEIERDKAGLTKTRLAKELGICEKTYYNWERSGAFTLAAMKKLADLFGCTIEHLMDRST